MKRVLSAIAIVLAGAGCFYLVGDRMAISGLLRIGVLLLALVGIVAISKGWLRDTALVLASLCVGLAVFETIALTLERPPLVYSDTGMTKADQWVGFDARKPGVYRFKASTRGGKPVFDTEVTIGDDLLRASSAPKGPGALVFFGDSFTFGAGVDDKDTIVQATSDLLHDTVPIRNASYNGWSPANNLAFLQHDFNADELRGARHFVLMTMPWHIERIACKVSFNRGTPRFVLRGDGSLAENGTCPGLSSFRYDPTLRSFAFYRFFLLPRLNRITKADADTYFSIVDAFVRSAKAKYGVDTTILIDPQPWFLKHSIGMDEDALERRLARSGADVLVNPFSDGAYTIPLDGHPTALANRMKAKLLLDRLAVTQPAFATGVDKDRKDTAGSARGSSTVAGSSAVAQ